ncbi:uncharacterized protein [Anser cygnoides]|uniref:uncharacterized protein isoform X2 n=1 Tax=Anser cygnoides TaxID=8845 RepID=UPI0034D1FB2B
MQPLLYDSIKQQGQGLDAELLFQIFWKKEDIAELTREPENTERERERGPLNSMHVIRLRAVEDPNGEIASLRDDTMLPGSKEVPKIPSSLQGMKQITLTSELPTLTSPNYLGCRMWLIEKRPGREDK